MQANIYWAPTVCQATVLNSEDTKVTKKWLYFPRANTLKEQTHKLYMQLQ